MKVVQISWSFLTYKILNTGFKRLLNAVKSSVQHKTVATPIQIDCVQLYPLNPEMGLRGHVWMTTDSGLILVHAEAC